jgi:hypothetical protein
VSTLPRASYSPSTRTFKMRHATIVAALVCLLFTSAFAQFFPPFGVARPPGTNSGGILDPTTVRFLAYFINIPWSRLTERSFFRARSCRCAKTRRTGNLHNKFSATSHVPYIPYMPYMISNSVSCAIIFADPRCRVFFVGQHVPIHLRGDWRQPS